MADELPMGMPFHRVYLDPGPPKEAIGAKARFRLHKMMRLLFADFPLANFLEEEVGKPVPWMGAGGKNFEKYLEHLTDHEVLHVITATSAHARSLDKRSQKGDGALTTLNKKWVVAAGRILQEENIGYRIDDLGGVHPIVDLSFYREVEAAVAGLGKPRYANVRAELEKGLGAIDQLERDWKAGVRGTFFAIEGLFRLLFKDIEHPPERLVSGFVMKNFKPRLAAIADKNERVAFESVVASFQDWVDAAQQYRHEPGTEDPHQPPQDLALVLIGQGLSFIRWLVAQDRDEQPR